MVEMENCRILTVEVGFLILTELQSIERLQTIDEVKIAYLLLLLKVAFLCLQRSNINKENICNKINFYFTNEFKTF